MRMLRRCYSLCDLNPGRDAWTATVSHAPTYCLWIWHFAWTSVRLAHAGTVVNHREEAPAP